MTRRFVMTKHRPDLLREFLYKAQNGGRMQQQALDVLGLLQSLLSSHERAALQRAYFQHTCGGGIEPLERLVASLAAPLLEQ